MSWFLRIDTPRSKYRAGDTVSGFVYLVSQHAQGQEVDVGSIAIEFTGRSTTMRNWPRIPHTIRLFSFKQNLFTGAKRVHVPYGHAEATGRDEWPFSFTLPSNCSQSEGDLVVYSPYFNSEPNQPLPISMKDDNGQGGSCSIVYELKATLWSPLKDDSYTNESSTQRMEILVHRPRRTEQPTFDFNTKSAAFTYQSLLLLPKEKRELVHRPLTIKEKLKLKPPSTDHLPKAVFTIRVQTPSAAVIGQPLPLMLHVDYDVKSSTVPRPVFHLRRVSFHLCEETSIWDLKGVGDLESSRWTRQITLQKKEFKSQGPRVEEHLDLRNVMDTAIKRDVTPTLKTYNIARAYALKVFVGLECSGEVHLVFGDYKLCTLFAAEYDSQIRAHDEPAPITDGERNDPPPPYDFVTHNVVPGYSSQTHRTRQCEVAMLDRAG